MNKGVGALVYDIEIKKGILGRGEKPVEGIQYCEGWHDHANMGVSVVGCYDYVESRHRVFCDDNIDQFYQLCQERELLVHFNGLSFDNKVMAATYVELPENLEHYDILVEQWAASGLGPVYQSSGHGGFGLDATAQKNLGIGKTGHGARAPVLYQQGRWGELVDYCLTDVDRTKRLFDLILYRRDFLSPKTGEPLAMRRPFAIEAA